MVFRLNITMNNLFPGKKLGPRMAVGRTVGALTRWWWWRWWCLCCCCWCWGWWWWWDGNDDYGVVVDDEDEDDDVYGVVVVDDEMVNDDAFYHWNALCSGSLQSEQLMECQGDREVRWDQIIWEKKTENAGQII